MSTERPQGTLDERIAAAEQRLVAREQVVRQRAQALLKSVQEATTAPRRMVRPALYALGALALVWGAARMLRRRPRAAGTGPRSASGAPAAASPAPRVGELPWVRAVALLWPLLPVAWRGRMGPDAASILVAFGLPLAGLLFSKRSRAPLPHQRSE